MTDVTDLYQRAIRYWGAESQQRMTIEECAELQVALSHYRRGRCSSLMVAEEIADVEIMLEQMRLLFGNKHVDGFKEEKLKRLKERLDNKTIADAEHAVIFGIERAETFKIELPVSQVGEKAREIWRHPSQFSIYEDGSDDAYYKFLRFLWIRYPDGREVRLTDVAAKGV